MTGEPDHRPPTLLDVARHLGVHASTVSRALSTDPRVSAGVASGTRARVLDAAQELGYRRNRAGASLRTGRTGIIGVLVPWITDIAAALVYEAFDCAAGERGYVTLIGSTREDLAGRDQRIGRLLDHGVDAIVHCDGHLDERSQRDFAVPVLPFMRARGTRPPVCSADDEDGGRQVAVRLAELGHRHVGVVAGPVTASTAVDRTAGFVREWRRRGLPLPPDAVAVCGFDVASSKDVARRLLSARPRPTAVYAVHDLAAVGVMAAAREAGLVVPEELSVIGFNDIPVAAELPVPLTTIRSPLAEAGAATLEAVLSALGGIDPTPVRLPVTLVVRESCAPAPGA